MTRTINRNGEGAGGCPVVFYSIPVPISVSLYLFPVLFFISHYFFHASHVGEGGGSALYPRTYAIENEYRYMFLNKSCFYQSSTLSWVIFLFSDEYEATKLLIGIKVIKFAINSSFLQYRFQGLLERYQSSYFDCEKCSVQRV